MSVLTAAVVLAWGCLIVLTLALAGMLRQLRELQAEVAQLATPGWRGSTGRRVAELAGAGPLLLLVLDPGCSFCDLVHEPFTKLADAHPDTRFEVLSPHQRWASSTVSSRVDQRLVTELDLPWAPALVVADAAGTVLAARPVQTPERLGEQVAHLLDTALTAPHRTGAA
ncbi:MAG TPA: hypothetical protein VFQ77_12590 [Pseudonocardiaceae bacterium]|jgi:hypothetical protein|nr:hypothetical protein [Pseudonocardiaceae bacterium]